MRVRALSFLAVVSADSMVVGSVGPWATGPHFELSGLSSNIRRDPSLLPGAGRTVLGLALAGCVGFVLTRRHRTAGWFPAGLGLVATAMSVDHIRTAFQALRLHRRADSGLRAGGPAHARDPALGPIGHGR